MDINFNEVDKSIEIKDGLKSHLFLMKLLMIVTLTNSVLNLSGSNAMDFGFVTVIWLVLGSVSTVILYNSFFKKSGIEKIPVGQIRGLNERNFLGRKKYFIELTNGKTRDLLEVKSESELAKLRKMFRKNGIID